MQPQMLMYVPQGITIPAPGSKSLLQCALSCWLFLYPSSAGVHCRLFPLLDAFLSGLVRKNQNLVKYNMRGEIQNSLEETLVAGTGEPQYGLSGRVQLPMSFVVLQKSLFLRYFG